jgi:hypothetical protein
VAMWEAYARPNSPEEALGEDEAARGRDEAMFAAVEEAIANPHLPDGDGSVMFSYDPAVEGGHHVGRALHAIRDP